MPTGDERLSADRAQYHHERLVIIQIAGSRPSLRRFVVGSALSAPQRFIK